MTFIDTNVLVYATVEGAPHLDRARAALANTAVAAPATISRQILREHVSVVTRPLGLGKLLALAQAISDTAGFIRQFGYSKTAQWSGTTSSG